MDHSNQEGEGKKEISDVKTFPINIGSKEINQDINHDENIFSKLTEEEIINQAINFHSQGNIIKASKYYQYFINKGFNDHRVFANYGGILKNLGKFKEAKIFLLKAINIKPGNASLHFNLGNTLKDLGTLNEAAFSYRKAIEINPDFAMAYFNLGNILSDLGESKEAEFLYRKAIEIQPEFANAHFNLGNILRTDGQLNEAEFSYRKAIEINPDFTMAHFNLGNILSDLEKLNEAEFSYRKAIKLQPDLANSHFNLGNTLRNLGKSNEAEFSYRKAIELNPDFAEAHSNLGGMLKNNGNYKEAEIYTRKAIEIQSDLASAHLNLGNILRDLGKLEQAELSTRKAIQLAPNDAITRSNLGTILRDLGKLQEAELSTRKAIQLNPEFAEAYSNLGSILKDIGNPKDAEISYLKAIEIKPDFAEFHSNLGIMLIDLGKVSDAIKYFSSASRYAPNNIIHFINSKLIFSPIMQSNLQIDSERNQYKKEINNLKNRENMYFEKPNSFFPSIFYLAYQNKQDDRAILEEFSEAISKTKGIICNGFSYDKYLVSSSKRKKLKIGVCSMFLRSNHSVGKCFINVLKDLSQTDIEMTLYIIPDNKHHSLRKGIHEHFTTVINLPNCPQIASEIILSDQLDLIFYPDIGMTSFSYVLALSKLALVQVNGLGHGSTSGIKNIDYYITHGDEPIKSDLDYTETLIRFRRLPFNFTPPKIDENKITKKNIINSSSKFYIGLIQSLVKLHPNYDEILESILLKIENSYLVLITDKSNYNFKLLQDRWNKKNKLLIERSIFLDSMEKDDFLHITRSCDIMLDPFYFGGGVTFYEAMTYGIPFITYPHSQKVRIVSAGYKQMKIKNPPIAYSPEDYVNWCIKYSKDKYLLDSTKRELRQKAEKYLFNDLEIYKDYYKFFKESVKKARKEL